MSNKTDTIDTIVDDMLNDGHTGPADSLEWVQAKMKFYAERIKEAWKRQMSQSWHHREMEELVARHEKEVAELKARLPEPDPNAALRDALSDACYAMFNFLKTQNGGYEEMANALDKAKAALAAPPRNCDIYTDIDSALRACHEDRCYHKSPIDERRSVISFMLSTNTSGEANKDEGEPDESK